MRHHVYGKSLGRTHNAKHALFRGLVRSFFTHGKMQTTQAKVQAVIRPIENICTLAVNGDLVSRREMFKTLQSQNWVNLLCKSIKAAYGEQTSNFIRQQKVGFRQGDNSLMILLTFFKPVDLKMALKESKVEDKAKPAVKEKDKKEKTTVKTVKAKTSKTKKA